mgnify:FL=1
MHSVFYLISSYWTLAAIRNNTLKRLNWALFKLIFRFMDCIIKHFLSSLFCNGGKNERFWNSIDLLLYIYINHLTLYISISFDIKHAFYVQSKNPKFWLVVRLINQRCYIINFCKVTCIFFVKFIHLTINFESHWFSKIIYYVKRIQSLPWMRINLKQI